MEDEQKENRFYRTKVKRYWLVTIFKQNGIVWSQTSYHECAQAAMAIYDFYQNLSVTNDIWRIEIQPTTVEPVEGDV